MEVDLRGRGYRRLGGKYGRAERQDMIEQPEPRGGSTSSAALSE